MIFPDAYCGEGGVAARCVVDGFGDGEKCRGVDDGRVSRAFDLAELDRDGRRVSECGYRRGEACFGQNCGEDAMREFAKFFECCLRLGDRVGEDKRSLGVFVGIGCRAGEPQVVGECE